MANVGAASGCRWFLGDRRFRCLTRVSSLRHLMHNPDEDTAIFSPRRYLPADRLHEGDVPFARSLVPVIQGQ